MSNITNFRIEVESQVHANLRCLWKSINVDKTAILANKELNIKTFKRNQPWKEKILDIEWIVVKNLSVRITVYLTTS